MAARTEGLGNAIRVGIGDAELFPALRFFGYLVALLLVALVIGQKLALPLFVLAYLRRWGRYGWRIAAIYAFACWVVLVLFYELRNASAVLSFDAARVASTDVAGRHTVLARFLSASSAKRQRAIHMAFTRDPALPLVREEKK